LRGRLGTSAWQRSRKPSRAAWTLWAPCTGWRLSCWPRARQTRRQTCERRDSEHALLLQASAGSLLSRYSFGICMWEIITHQVPCVYPPPPPPPPMSLPQGAALPFGSSCAFGHLQPKQPVSCVWCCRFTAFAHQVRLSQQSKDSRSRRSQGVCCSYQHVNAEFRSHFLSQHARPPLPDAPRPWLQLMKACWHQVSAAGAVCSYPPSRLMFCAHRELFLFRPALLTRSNHTPLPRHESQMLHIANVAAT
jgi:hypothetical protein